MERFLTRHNDRIVGILSGFDRLLFRGTLRWLCYPDGMGKFLGSQGVLYKDFGAYAARLSDRVKAHAMTIAADAGRPYEYLPSAHIAKEDRARAIAQRDSINEGLVCVLSCVEPCRSFTVRRDRARKDIQLVSGERKCLHLYFYVMDRDFGLMHVRLQTWLPFTIQVCVNGRAWLACQLRRAGITHTQVDNCFTTIADLPRAQTMADDLIDWSWEPWLHRLARLVNPWLREPDLFGRGYYWTVRQSEYATDVLFRNAAAVQAVYPSLLRHAIETFQSEDVLRFLGHQPVGLSREVRSTLERRVEAVRIRHWVNENSIKMYDKAGSLIRIETTLNNPDRFKVRRRRPSDGRLDWLPLRRGIADMRRRAAIGLAANARYLDALSVVGESTPSHRLLDPVSERVTHRGRSYRPLRPISPQEAPLLQTIFRGESRLQGFTNRDVRTALTPHANTTDPLTCRRLSARVTRQLRLLRAHHLIKKIPGTHLYRITKRGEAVISTALKFRETDMALLAA